MVSYKSYLGVLEVHNGFADLKVALLERQRLLCLLEVVSFNCADAAIYLLQLVLDLFDPLLQLTHT
jgi:hypothetical protein